MAGTIESILYALSKNLDAGRAREMQTIRPASHTTALGELFIAEVWAGAQGEVYEVDSEAKPESNALLMAARISDDRLFPCYGREIESRRL